MKTSIKNIGPTLCLTIHLLTFRNLTKLCFRSLKSLYLKTNKPWYLTFIFFTLTQLFILISGFTVGFIALAISHYTGHLP